MQHWVQLTADFKQYLRIERAGSVHSIRAYHFDLQRLMNFVEKHYPELTPQNISTETLREFLYHSRQSIGERSLARLLSATKTFFKYLCLEGHRSDNPTDGIEAPKIGRKIPSTLSVKEIFLMLESIDLSQEEGHRNKAILDTLYSCGLRVSELVSLRLSNLFFEEDFIKVEGKGNKERLIPIAPFTQKQIKLYLQWRNSMKILPQHADFVFLNRRGKPLTRAMIFHIVKETALQVGISKRISPHTLRHSFATHLLENGASLVAIQQMLGHEHISTTEIYMHLDNKALRDTLYKYHPLSKRTFKEI